nr:hypothetical protein CFP56_76111 [Quercus suber]
MPPLDLSLSISVPRRPQIHASPSRMSAFDGELKKSTIIFAGDLASCVQDDSCQHTRSRVRYLRRGECCAALEHPTFHVSRSFGTDVRLTVSIEGPDPNMTSPTSALRVCSSVLRKQLAECPAKSSVRPSPINVYCDHHQSITSIKT